MLVRRQSSNGSESFFDDLFELALRSKRGSTGRPAQERLDAVAPCFRVVDSTLRGVERSSAPAPSVTKPRPSCADSSRRCPAPLGCSGRASELVQEAQRFRLEVLQPHRWVVQRSPLLATLPTVVSSPSRHSSASSAEQSESLARRAALLARDPRRPPSRTAAWHPPNGPHRTPFPDCVCLTRSRIAVLDIGVAATSTDSGRLIAAMAYQAGSEPVAWSERRDTMSSEALS